MTTGVPTTDLTGCRARHFDWRVVERVGQITLGRPERKNPLTFDSYAESHDLFRALAYAGDVGTVVISGDDAAPGVGHGH